MMRSMAVSMKSSSARSDEFSGFELRDRLVGELDPVEFAAVKQLRDDLEQPFVGGEGFANGAGPAQRIRGDGIGIADHLYVHHPQPALDQHDLGPPIPSDKARHRAKVPFRKNPVFANKNKTPRSGKPGPMRLGKSLFIKRL